ncbi:MAG: PRC-barrel domain-containing protein [Synechococcales cyanobacterium M58_A2018_015]|nr:PRC-barrel domain-containing protein [Synechococcales cyanobacterium M58_A2018_015]
MPLLRLDEFNMRNQSQSDSYRLKGMPVHSDLTAGMIADRSQEHLGTVSDLLVNETGAIEYLVLDLGSSLTGRQVMLPIDRARIDHKENCVYAMGMTKDQVEQLPAFTSELSL